MSAIKIEFESEDNAVVVAIAALTDSLLGRKAKSIEVAEAEEVETPPKTPPKTRPSRAKKPEPVIVEEEEEEETEEEETEEVEDDEAETITEDDVKAMLAKKVATNRDAIVKKLKGYGASKISELDSTNYKGFYDFMAKLK